MSRLDSGVSQIVGWGVDEAGVRVGQEQQDSFLLNHTLGFFAVFDGVGGNKGGAEASKLAAQVLTRRFSDLVDMLNEGDAADWLPRSVASMIKEALKAVSKAIHQAGKDDPNLEGMSTTATGVFFYGGNAYFFNVGDSRCYRVRDGDLEQMTHDHSWVADMVFNGHITREEARHHPDRSIITSSLGFERELYRVDVLWEQAKKGDAWIICSDGLPDYADPDRWEVLATSRLMRGSCPEEVATMLTNLTTANAGVYELINGRCWYRRCDNTTVIVVRVCA